MAREIPVVPAVYSTTVPPGGSLPSVAARSTMARATRSFMLPVGLADSSFAMMRADPAGTTRRSSTSGVLPMASSTCRDVPVSNVTSPCPAVADGIKETCVSDLGSVLGELDVDPCNDVTERTVLERPSCALRRAQVVVADLLEDDLPLPLQPAEPLAYTVGGARPQHVLA